MKQEPVPVVQMKNDITCFLGMVIEATKKFVEDKKYKRV